MKMNIRKGDKVQVITGKDKGKQGVVLRGLPKEERVLVEGVNMVKKAMRPTQQNPQGGIVTKEGSHPRLQRDARLPDVRQADPYR